MPDLPPALSARSVQWLPAEVSARRYARLHEPRGVRAPTAVAMCFSPGTRPAEVARVARATRLLGEAGIPVPRIHAVDEEQRWILQEDLGDVTLAAARAAGRPVAEAYSEAVGLLQRLSGLELDTSPRPPLDARRLRDELDLFARTALSLPEGPGASLAADFDQLVARCTELPVVLCHRDYHARNLMLHEGRVRVVDHQDALPGPAGYDRVSLAYDPYVALPDPVRDRIAGESEGAEAVAVQRLAKAIGTFAQHGGAWRRCIPDAARQARRLLARRALALPVLDLGLATLTRAAPLEAGS